jgi:predicted NUDIX family phosphoesterase
MKLALCAHREHVAIDFNVSGLHAIPPSFDTLAVSLVDRAVCEQDESLQQLIPYISLFTVDGRIFVYERGAAGEEDRLKRQLSVGLGGHVDRAPADGETLNDLLCREGERELLEEVGIKRTLTGFNGLLAVNERAVDRVHLGVSTSVIVEPGESMTHEEGTITNGHFTTLETLLLPHNFQRLEAWSQAVVMALAAVPSESEAA